MDPSFLPYARQTIEPDDIDAVVRVLQSDLLTTGPVVPAFEEALAQRVDLDWSVAVTSGTAALHAACVGAGVKDGDEVIVPAVTFVADANCARYVGAEPVFVDVHPDTGLIDVSQVEARMTPKTRAIIAVHLTGALADVAALAEIADRHGVVLIEDAAHALGANGLPSVSNGLRVYSFHPVKHVTTGEGGAVAGHDATTRDRLREFRNHGITRDPARLPDQSGPWYYEQQSLGHNLRMTDIQAALGLSQLGKLDRFLATRRTLANRYDEQLEQMPHVVPVTTGGARRSSAYHLYGVRVAFDECGLSRTQVMHAMRERGIGSQVHYIPIPMHPYYQARGWDAEDFPGALHYYARALSLPLFPGMTEDDVDRVVDVLGGVLHGTREESA